MLDAKQLAYHIGLVLVLLNGSAGMLLWRGPVTGFHRAVSASIPYTLDHRLVITIMPADTRIRSYQSYPATFDYSSRGRPNQVWVHVWTQDKPQHTFTNNIFFMLPLGCLAVLLLLAMNLPLLLLTLGLWYAHRRRGAVIQPVPSS